MKNIIFGIILVFCTLFPVTAVNNADSKTTSDTVIATAPETRRIVIYTPTTDVYDDGVEKILYTGYQIYDLNGNLLKNVSSSPQTPVKLKIRKGTYIIKSSLDSIPPHQITVDENTTPEYVITRMSTQN